MKPGLKQLLDYQKPEDYLQVRRPLRDTSREQSVGPRPTVASPWTSRLEMSLSGPVGQLNEKMRGSVGIGLGDFSPLYLADRYLQGPVDAGREAMVSGSVDPVVRYGNELPSMLTEDVVLGLLTAPGKAVKGAAKTVKQKAETLANRFGRVLTTQIHTSEPVDDDGPDAKDMVAK